MKAYFEGSGLRAAFNKTIASAAEVGVAFGGHATDPNAGTLASSNNFLGFLSRPVVAARSTREIYEGVSGSDNDALALESPTLTGAMATLEDYELVEIEANTDGSPLAGSPGFVVSSTGAIDGTAPVGTLLAFVGGQLRVKQTADVATHILTANSRVASSLFTPAAASGTCRIQARRLG